MKKIFLNNAFSLIELIVATVLVSIVLLGIFAVNSVLNTNNLDYGQRFLVRSETQSTMDNILNNASSAYGSAAGGNPAFLIGSAAQLVDPDTFCIQQLTSAGADIWVCYSYNPATFVINSCTMSFSANTAPYYGASSCSTAPILLSGPTYVGTAFSNPLATFTSTGTQLTFSVTLVNCLNNTLASCQAAGTSLAPGTNPEVLLSGTTYPLQVSQ